MPNNYNAGIEILKGLFQLTGQGLAKTGKAVGNYYMNQSPIAMLSQLIGQASAEPARQELQASTKGTKTEQAIQQGVVKNPYMQGAEKALKASGEADMTQSIQQQGGQASAQKFMEMQSLESPITQEEILPGAQQINEALTNQTQQLSQEQPQERIFPDNRGIVEQFFQMLGIGPTAQDELTSAQTESIRQKTAGKEPLQEGRYKELQIMHKNKMKEIMASQGINEDQATAEIFKADLMDLVNNYNKVNLKGTFGNLIGAPLGAMGVDREDRKAFEASADSLVYSVASYIAGQEGRSLSDKDITLVNRWAKFNLNDRTKDFRGKLKNLIQKANVRLSKAGGTLLPDVGTLLGQSQPSDNMPKVTSFEIEE